MRLDPKTFTPNSGTLQRKPFTSRVVLTDGGVYDNLGLETVWKRYQTVLVSDAGGKTARPKKSRRADWAQHSYRVLNLIDNQVRALRKRQVIDSFKTAAADAAHRKGAYWGIRTNIADYKLPNALDCPFDRTLALAETPTRLKRMDDQLQERLINWGYAVCDAALRKHVDPAIKPAPAFPYPARGVRRWPSKFRVRSSSSFCSGPADDRRQLQDSPILGDVWVAFAKEPDERSRSLDHPLHAAAGGDSSRRVSMTDMRT